jgi:two-component system phosphate regulon response regulator PhoB
MGNVACDEEDHSVSIGGVEIPFTVTEFKLLQFFLKRKGRVQTRENLLLSVWKFDAEVETRTVDVHIRRLRKKMETADLEIETVRGVGYRLAEKAK